jgi:hypothetical protein
MAAIIESSTERSRHGEKQTSEKQALKEASVEGSKHQEKQTRREANTEINKH